MQDVVIKAELPDDEAGGHQGDVREQRADDRRRARSSTSAVTREQYHRLERVHGAFRRSFTLPASVDSAQAQATYQDGVLTVTLPRREETKPRQIAING